jgi:hypothetical protein
VSGTPADERKEKREKRREERAAASDYPKDWFARATGVLGDLAAREAGSPADPGLDSAALLQIIRNLWNEVFRDTLGHAERTLVSELRTVRDTWAHQGVFTTNDTYRALDARAAGALRLLGEGALRTRHPEVWIAVPADDELRAADETTRIEAAGSLHAPGLVRPFGQKGVFAGRCVA